MTGGCVHRDAGPHGRFCGQPVLDGLRVCPAHVAEREEGRFAVVTFDLGCGRRTVAGYLRPGVLDEIRVTRYRQHGEPTAATCHVGELVAVDLPDAEQIRRRIYRGATVRLRWRGDELLGTVQRVEGHQARIAFTSAGDQPHIAVRALTDVYRPDEDRVIDVARR